MPLPNTSPQRRRSLSVGPKFAKPDHLPTPPPSPVRPPQSSNDKTPMQSSFEFPPSSYASTAYAPAGSVVGPDGMMYIPLQYAPAPASAGFRGVAGSDGDIGDAQQQSWVQQQQHQQPQWFQVQTGDGQWGYYSSDGQWGYPVALAGAPGCPAQHPIKPASDPVVATSAASSAAPLVNEAPAAAAEVMTDPGTSEGEKIRALKGCSPDSVAGKVTANSSPTSFSSNSKRSEVTQMPSQSRTRKRSGRRSVRGRRGGGGGLQGRETSTKIAERSENTEADVKANMPGRAAAISDTMVSVFSPRSPRLAWFFVSQLAVLLLCFMLFRRSPADTGLPPPDVSSLSSSLPPAVNAVGADIDTLLTQFGSGIKRGFDDGELESEDLIEDTGVAPAVDGEPFFKAISEGDPLTIVIRTLGSPPPSHQWRLNGVEIPGATEPVFHLPSTTIDDAGTYTCVVSNPKGQVVWEEGFITIRPSEDRSDEDVRFSSVSLDTDDSSDRDSNIESADITPSPGSDGTCFLPRTTFGLVVPGDDDKSAVARKCLVDGAPPVIKSHIVHGGSVVIAAGGIGSGGVLPEYIKCFPFLVQVADTAEAPVVFKLVEGLRAIYEPSRHRERNTQDRTELARLCTLLTFEVGLYSAGAVHAGHRNGRADLLVDAVTYFLGSGL